MNWHAYWAVVCKTADCNKMLFPKDSYIGPCGETDESVSASFGPPEWVDLRCPDCDREHRYTREDFVVVRMDHRVEPDAEPDR